MFKAQHIDYSIIQHIFLWYSNIILIVTTVYSSTPFHSRKHSEINNQIKHHKAMETFKFDFLKEQESRLWHSLQSAESLFWEWDRPIHLALWSFFSWTGFLPTSIEEKIVGTLMQFITTMLTTEIENRAWHWSIESWGSRFYYIILPRPHIFQWRSVIMKCPL